MSVLYIHLYKCTIVTLAVGSYTLIHISVSKQMWWLEKV